MDDLHLVGNTVGVVKRDESNRELGGFMVLDD